MSANSDSQKLLKLAKELGFDIVKSKHGGYTIFNNGRVIARIHTGTNQRTHSVAKARRNILRESRKE